MPNNQPLRTWDEHDREAEREAGHAPGHHNKRMRYRSGLQKRGMTDNQWDKLVNDNQ